VAVFCSLAQVSGKREQRLRRVAPVVGGLVVLGAVAAVLLLRDSGPPPGKGIVFQAKVDGLYQLFRVDPDGRGLRQLTHLDFRGSTVPGVERAVWSPDGERIAFDSDYRRTKDRVITLYTMKPDGSDLAQLPIQLGRFTLTPAYSPDGKLLSFDWARSTDPTDQDHQGIFIARPDGTGLRRLTRLDQPTAHVGRTNWSPDGRWLVFAQSLGPPESSNESVIVKMRPDGTGRRELTLWALDANNAKWSPDGSRIAFNSHNGPGPHPGESANVFTMKPDGTGVVQLTHYTGGTRNAYLGGWSPDGRQLVVHISGADPNGSDVNQLFALDVNSGHLRQLTQMPRGSNPSFASWSPAG
jgi:Tol biopolymer transport system component